MSEFALRTFKCSQIGTRKAGLDTDQHHENLTLGAARPLDDAKGMRFGHVMHSLGSREIATKLSVTDKAIGHVSRLSHLSAWLVLTYVRSGVIFAMIMTELLPICLRWPVREAELR